MGKEGISYANRHVQRGLETFGSTLLGTIFEEFKINTDIELSNDMQPNLSGGVMLAGCQEKSIICIPFVPAIVRCKLYPKIWGANTHM